MSSPMGEFLLTLIPAVPFLPLSPWLPSLSSSGRLGHRFYAASNLDLGERRVKSGDGLRALPNLSRFIYNFQISFSLCLFTTLQNRSGF